MAAIIQFIGLVTFVTTTSITPAPPHILIPQFSDIIPAANNVIAVPIAAVDSSATTWPLSSSDTTFNYYAIGTKNIRISGDGGFTNDVTNIPHLTCCCTAMKQGLKPAFDKPDFPSGGKKSAYVFLDHGFLSAPSQPDQATQLQLAVSSTTGQIVITGSVTSQPDVTITVNLPRNGNTTIGFLNQPGNDAHADHWAHYYQMAAQANACLKNPKNDPSTCGPENNPNGCLPNIRSGSNTITAAPRARTAQKAPATIHGAHPTAACLLCQVTDINCSGSAWP